MPLTRIGATLMTLAVLAALATIWWDGHRWQSGATTVLLLFTAVACLTANDKENDQ